MWLTQALTNGRLLLAASGASAEVSLTLLPSFRKLANAAVSVLSRLSESDRLLFKEATDEDGVVTTVETVFYAQVGGQSYDTGTMRSEDGGTTFKVTSVRNGSGGQILHLGRFQPAASSFDSEDTVHQAIDGEKRDLNSRIHTGGHLVGLAVRHLRSVIPDVSELKAQHYPELSFVDFRGNH